MNNNKYALVKFIDNDLELDITISPEEDNIWLSKNQIAELFDRDRSVISKHIKKIFNDYECDEKSNVQKMHIPNSDKLVEFYSLDIIIAVGFKTNSKRAIIFRRWANKILKEYLLTGYVINKERSLVTNENYVRLINKVESLDERVSNIENNYKPKEFENSQLFFDGQIYDAYTFVNNLISRAVSEIVLIDGYVDLSVLDMLARKKSSVNVTIVTHPKNNLTAQDIQKFNAQYPTLNVFRSNKFHDRFFIIDQQELYHIGASLKDLGIRCFGFSKMDVSLIPEILEKII